MTVCVILLVLCALSLAIAAAYAQEMRRVTRFLTGSDPTSNERLSVSSSLPGCMPLVRALDERLEADRARDRARRMEEQRFQEGLAALSHDIRTPLAGAKGYLQLAAEETDEEAREACLDAAAKRLGAMQDLLDQLFSYVRSMDALSVEELRETDAVALLESVLAGAYPLFEAHSMELELVSCSQPFIVEADPEALKRVLENVVRNAVEHGEGALRIVREGAALSFSNGLDAHRQVDASRVFDRFYQADASRGGGNAGLGLPTVRNLCNAMGIHVSADASEGTFTLRLLFPQA